jgi:hypothetical protein
MLRFMAASQRSLTVSRRRCWSVVTRSAANGTADRHFVSSVYHQPPPPTDEGTTLIFAIMPPSSCSRMWQW